MRNKVIANSAVFLLVVGMAAIANCATITDGFTYAVASGSDQSVGTHYHSNTGGAFGNPAGLAEVGNYSTEEVRGLSEYNLAGLSLASDAFVTFDVYGVGLFPGVNNFPFDGDIDIFAYQGNNAEDITDYQAATVGYVGSFSTIGITAGDIISFNITSIFNDFITNGWGSLGIRLQTEDVTTGDGAWVFNDFRLTNTDDSSKPVPEPATLLLLGSGFAGVTAVRRKRKSS